MLRADARDVGPAVTPLWLMKLCPGRADAPGDQSLMRRSVASG